MGTLRRFFTFKKSKDEEFKSFTRKKVSPLYFTNNGQGLVNTKNMAIFCAFVAFLIFYSIITFTDNNHARRESRRQPTITDSRVWGTIVTSNYPSDIPSLYDLGKGHDNKKLLHNSSISQDTKIPKIAHFIFFSSLSGDLFEWGGSGHKNKPRPFSLINYLALRAAYYNLNPHKIFFYCDVEPVGPFWQLSKPIITVIKVDKVTNIFGNKIASIEHMSDVLRMRILLQHGGSYFDTDIIILKSFDDVYNEKSGFIMGREEGVTDAGVSFVGLCNAVIIASSNSKFLKKWYQSYVDFNDHEWSEHSVRLPWKLARLIPDSITILNNRRFYWPLWTSEGLKTLFEENEYDFSENYAVHLWGKISWQDYVSTLTFQTILSKDTSFHRILRPLLPHPLFSILSRCHNQEDIPKLQNTLLSIIAQTFQLYEIIIGDFTDDGACASEIRRLFIPAHIRLHSPNTISFVTTEVESTHLSESIMKERARGAWTITVSPGETISPSLLMEAQDYLVDNPSSFLNDVSRFEDFHFRFMAEERLSLKPNTDDYRMYRQGKFPELNPSSIPFDNEELASSAFFNIMLLENPDSQIRPATLRSIRQSKILARATVIEVQDHLEDNIRKLWPGKITARAYRSLIFNETSFSAKDVDKYLLHIGIWEECQRSQKPILVIPSGAKIGSDFDAKFVAAIQSLPLDFGLLYVGNIEDISDDQSDDVVSVDFTMIHWDAYLISPRLAEFLLDGVYPLDIKIDSYIKLQVKRFAVNIYRTKKTLFTIPSVELKADVEVFRMHPQHLHVVHLDSSSLWDRMIPVSSEHIDFIYKSPLQLSKKDWTMYNAGIVDPFFLESNPQDKLYELRLLHLKLSIICKYGGLLVDKGFIPSYLNDKGTKTSPFIAYLDHESKSYTPVFPLIMAPAYHPELIKLKDELEGILKDNGESKSKTEMSQIQSIIRTFINDHTSDVPTGDEIVSFPLGILME